MKKRKKTVADPKDLTEQQKVERRYADFSLPETGAMMLLKGGRKMANYRYRNFG